MKLETKITKPLNQNLVEVEISRKNAPSKFYAVSNNNAKSFCDEYKNNFKNFNLVSNLAIVTSGLGSIALLSLFTKNISNSIFRTIINVLGASTCITGATHLTNNHYNEKTYETMRKYNAQKIIYDA